MKRKHWLICTALVLAAVVVVAILGLTGWFVHDTLPPDTAAELEAVAVPRYAEVSAFFTHEHDGDTSLPATGAAFIDVDGDGRSEIFFSGGNGQADALFRFDGTGLVPVLAPFAIAKEGDPASGAPSYGAASVDVDSDGRVDLFVSRGDGLWLYRNTEQGFERSKVNAHLNAETNGMSLALADLNHDGWIDLYVCGYIKPTLIKGLTVFNDPTYGGSSVLLINNGDNTFRDVTESAGLSYIHNTFQAVFVDADGDRDQDLIVAHDTGQVRTYRNVTTEGSPPRFEMVDNPTTDVFAYPMGIAVGAYNADDLPDFVFPNTGTTVPEFMARGDLRDDQVLNVDWIFFASQPGMRYADVAQKATVADYEFGWGAVFADMNRDGRQDLIAAENFIDFPAHRVAKLPGRYLLQNVDASFAPAGKEAGAENPHYGISPMVDDLNDDGVLDLVHVNLAGPSRLLLGQPPLAGHYLTIAVPDTPAFQNARLVVRLDDGTTLVDWFVGSEGFAVDQSMRRTIGLGGQAAVASVQVELADGRDCQRTVAAVDTTVTFRACAE